MRSYQEFDVRVRPTQSGDTTKPWVWTYSTHPNGWCVISYEDLLRTLVAITFYEKHKYLHLRNPVAMLCRFFNRCFDFIDIMVATDDYSAGAVRRAWEVLKVEFKIPSRD